MYNDTIKVANKIISYEDLYDIFSIMNEKLIYYKKVFQREELQNKAISYFERVWTFEDSSSKLVFDVDFYDDTYIKFDNFNSFLVIFQTRTEEIKSINVRFSLSYNATIHGNQESFHQYIDMFISETKMNIEVCLSSVDTKMDDIYELIKSKILNSPVKYDFVIKKKDRIYSIVGFALGFIPSICFVTLLCFVSVILDLFASSYILYPVSVLVVTAFFANIVASIKLDRFYGTIEPPKKYAGYDSDACKSLYKDDIDAFLESSEILIGKNIDNLKHRENILKNYEKYKPYLPYEIGILIVLSILVLLF